MLLKEEVYIVMVLESVGMHTEVKVLDYLGAISCIAFVHLDHLFEMLV